MQKVDTQKGRSLLELLAVVALMAIMSLAVYAIFRLAVDKARARTLEQEIQARITQLRHQALTSVGIKIGSIQIMSASAMQIQAIDQDDTTFTLRVGSDSTPLDYDLCSQLMKSHSFNPNNSDACQKNQIYADFIFPKFENFNQFEGPNGGNNNGNNSGTNTGGGNNSGNSGGNTGNNNGNETPAQSCHSHAHQVGKICKCDAGYYGNGTTSCTPCPAGRYSGTVGATSSSTCTPCPAGTYSETMGATSSSTCQMCDDEEWSSSGAASCSSCETGKTHNSNHTGCICDIGYFGNGTTCNLCGDRKYTDTAGQSSCQTCPAGQTHNSDHTNCENCTDTTTLGACGCDSDKAPNGNGGCDVPVSENCPPGQKGRPCAPCELGDETCGCTGNYPRANGQGGCLCDHTVVCNDLYGAEECESDYCFVCANDYCEFVWCEKKPDHAYCTEDYGSLPLPNDWFKCMQNYYKDENTCCAAGMQASGNQCISCLDVSTKGACHCPSNQYPDGQSGCCPLNSSITVRQGYQLTGTPCYCNEGYTFNNSFDGCVACSSEQCDPYEGMPCEDYIGNSDCGGANSDYYCHSSSNDCSTGGVGRCTKTPAYRRITYAPLGGGNDVFAVCESTSMNWYSAYAWCVAIGGGGVPALGEYGTPMETCLERLDQETNGYWNNCGPVQIGGYYIDYRGPKYSWTTTTSERSNITTNNDSACNVWTYSWGHGWMQEKSRGTTDNMFALCKRI